MKTDSITSKVVYPKAEYLKLLLLHILNAYLENDLSSLKHVTCLHCTFFSRA